MQHPTKVSIPPPQRPAPQANKVSIPPPQRPAPLIDMAIPEQHNSHFYTQVQPVPLRPAPRRPDQKVKSGKKLGYIQTPRDTLSKVM